MYPAAAEIVINDTWRPGRGLSPVSAMASLILCPARWPRPRLPASLAPRASSRPLLYASSAWPNATRNSCMRTSYSRLDRNL